MSTPPFLIGAALAFWGWQSGHFAVGVLLGAALEGLRALQLRVDLGVKEHSTIADLSTIGFVLLAVLLAANRGIAGGILQSFIWLPAALSPIIAAQLATADRRIPLSALFRYMRKLRRANPDIKDPPVDVSAVYAGLTLLAAGVANQRGQEYYLAVVAGAACLLYAARPRNASNANLAVGAAMLAAAAVIGYAGHIGLQQAQLSLFDWVFDLNMRTVDSDPYRVRTELGSLGRLKKYDAIVLRVYAEEKAARHPGLLHRSSYNTYVAGTWVARGAQMQEIESLADNETWILEKTAQPAAALQQVRMSSRFDNGRTMLPLPPGTTRIVAFPATQVERNALGSVHAKLAVDWANYEAQAVEGIASYSPPMAEDSVVPAEERDVLRQTVEALGLEGLPAAEQLRRIERHLGGFAYSTYREHPVPRGETALGDFLTRTRAGHCEYFATAATLLARAAGVPARYASGFAAIEYSSLEGAWVVRTRHSHAWARAWVDGRWVDLDTTPPAWGEEEANDAPVWQGLADLFRFAGFRWSQRGEFKAGDGWYVALAALALYLAWSVLRGRRIVREQKAAVVVPPRRPGDDSEFYAVEKSLPAREASETQSAWMDRILSKIPMKKLDPIREALRLHQRYRFDPAGLSRNERNRLRELCRGLAAPA